MATSVVEIVGDSSNLLIQATNSTGPDAIEFLSGSFRGCVEERRICTVFFVIGGVKTLEVRIEFSDPAFIETNIFGKPLYDVGRF